MAEKSIIEWTRSTFNPWIGCTKVSPGCDGCYAAVSTPARAMKIEWGAGKPRHRTSPSTWAQVRRWNAEAAATGEFRPIFTASLADVFDNEVPDEWRADFWTLVRECRHLTFQMVTKRIGNVPRMLPPDWGDAGYPNVWLLTVVCRSRRNIERWKGNHRIFQKTVNNFRVNSVLLFSSRNLNSTNYPASTNYR
jgi:protein gp37